jgi:hypothetical protein
VSSNIDISVRLPVYTSPYDIRFYGNSMIKSTVHKTQVASNLNSGFLNQYSCIPNKMQGEEMENYSNCQLVGKLPQESRNQ